MANLPKGGCVTQASIMRDIRDPLGHHLTQKYLKSGQKWLSYCQFTVVRLRDSSEYHVGSMGSIGASFELKISKIRPEMARLRPIYQWKVA